MVHVCPGMQYKTCNTRREVPALIYGATEGHELGAITYSREGSCVGCVGLGCRERAGPAQPPRGVSTGTAHAGPTTNWVLYLFPRGSSHLPRSASSPLKKKKGFSHPVTIRGTVRLLTWRSGPRERPRPRPPAGQAQPPPKAHAVGRGDRSGAHARGGAAPRASHFRRAGRSAVPGRCSSRRPAVGAGDARGVHGRPGRRGSAGCPQSGRCAGGGLRREQVPHSFSGLGLPPKRPGRG